MPFQQKMGSKFEIYKILKMPLNSFCLILGSLNENFMSVAEYVIILQTSKNNNKDD